MRTLKIVVAAVLAGSAGLVAAEDGGTGAAAFRPGWYVAPMVTYMKPDSARCNVDGDFGVSAALGHRGDFASLEVWGQFLKVPHGSCTYLVPGPSTPDPTDDERVPFTEPAGDVTLNGGGLGLLIGPFFEDRVLARFFGIIGFGVLLREGHPQYTSSDTTIFGDAGIGYAQPLELFGLGASLRADARYRYDVQQPPHPDASQQDPPPAHAFQDLIFNLGLQIPLSAAPEPAAEAAEPVAVVAVSDADGDGVPDENDTCPDTATGTMVDATGCAPAPVAAVAETAEEPTLETAKAGDTIVLHGVNFETARATLTTNARTLLDEVAAKLAARPELKIEIGGHTDSRGHEDYNQALSEKRARSVQDYLVKQGVATDSLTAVGYGEAQPTDSNDTDEGRERNRRVELKILEATPQANPTTTGESS